MKRAITIILIIITLFSFSSCYNYKLFGPVGNGKKNYYTNSTDNAPASKFNTHKVYKKKIVNKKHHKEKLSKSKRKNNSFGCKPFGK